MITKCDQASLMGSSFDKNHIPGPKYYTRQGGTLNLEHNFRFSTINLNVNAKNKVMRNPKNILKLKRIISLAYIR